MKCPHCKTDLWPHIELQTSKEGAQHCDGCGCCFQADGKTLRVGDASCPKVPAIEEVAEEEAPPVSVAEESTPIRGRARA